MRVFVTGSGGFIGSELTRQLVASGHEVVGLVRSLARAERVRALGAAPIVGDVRDLAVVRRGISGADAVAHLALPRAGEKRVQEANDISVRGTNALLEACRGESVRSFVLASGAGGIYRHGPAEWVDERTPEEPWTRATRDRFTVDVSVRQAHEEWGLPAAILRPPIVYGPGSGFRDFFLDFLRRRIYRVVGDGSYYTNLVHVEDCAAAWRLALERAPAGETLILVDNEPVQMRTFSDALAEEMGRPPPGRIPPFLAKFVVGRDAVEILRENVRFRNREARERLGWSLRYPTYRDGIPDVVRAYATASSPSGRGA